MGDGRQWKCEVCGKEGVRGWAELVRMRGSHFASNAAHRCAGKLVMVERRAAPDALVELRPLISQMEESLRYIGARKYLDLCRKMTAVLDAALRPVERGEEGA